MEEQIADAGIEETIAPEVSALDTPAETEPKSEAKPNEKPTETAQRALRDLQERSKNDGDQGADQPTKATEKAAAAKDGTKQVIDDKDLDPELLPPARFNAQEQKLFNNLPVGLKRALHRTTRSLEGMTTRERQELARATQESRGIIEAVQPFATKWGERGFTVPSAIAALAAAQEKLTNPETAVQTWVELGRDIGIDVDQLPETLIGNTQKISSQPQNHPLQEKVDNLYAMLEQQQIAKQSEPIVNEMQAVQHEVDPASGKYRFPELHDDNYLESLKPRISELAGIAIQEGRRPNYAEALKQANAERKAQLFGIASGQQNQIRVPAANTNVQQRAVSAAVTVRGKTQPVLASNGLNGIEIPQEARKNAQATARWVEQQLLGRTS